MEPLQLPSYDLERLPTIDEFFEEQELDTLFENYMESVPMMEDRRIPAQAGGPSAAQIRKAVRERQYIGVYYSEPGDTNLVKSGFRLIEPYVYGRGFKHPKTGNISHYNRQYIRAFVIRDSQRDVGTRDKKNFVRRKSVSKTKRVPYWRLMRVDRIQNWEIIGRKFSKFRPLYNPDDQMIRRIITKAQLGSFPRGEV